MAFTLRHQIPYDHAPMSATNKCETRQKREKQDKRTENKQAITIMLVCASSAFAVNWPSSSLIRIIDVNGKAREIERERDLLRASV